MDETIIKMLETAIHPSTDENTRANAMGLIALKVQKAGGVVAALTGTPRGGDEFFWFDEYKKLERTTKERDLFARRYFKLVSEVRGLTVEVDDIEDPAIALYGGLASDWRTLTVICSDARVNGFQGADNTLRKRADKLAEAGTIEVREAGYHRSAHCYEGRAWRLKA